ncbi:MAG: response regulator receiver domain [Candidatus Thiodiazotropha taylori]|nr:response regulator receiver domain [Candidatus Thiodiazotropha taylori]
MEAAQTFEELCLNAAERFVQSAIVVDNDSGFGPEEDRSPKVANAKLPPGSLPTAVGNEVNADEAGISDSAMDTHYLDFKALGEAFLDRKIVCGTYRPTSDDDMVDTTCKAASTADIAVIDWHLEGNGGGSLKAKEIITAILNSDKAAGPRLRLIAVYTAQQGLVDLATELKEYLEGEGIHDVSQDNGSSVLVSRHLRIAFFNKQATMAHVEGDPIAEERELPGLLLKEYAKLAKGILPSTAMSAIADIRKATPHLLTIFHSDLDGAYVGHRAMIPVSEDSEAFLRRLITEEVDAAIEGSGTVPHFAGEQAIEHWLDFSTNEENLFKDNDGNTCSVDAMKAILTCSSENPIKHNENFSNAITAGFGKIAPGIKKEFAQVFYDDGDEQTFLREFSRLCDLKREATPRTLTENSSLPILSLGTIVRPLPADGQGTLPSGVDQGELLLCVQPRCDSVRLAKGLDRNFPFLKLRPNQSRFHLVCCVDNQQQTYEVITSPYSMLMMPFSPAEEAKPKIEATPSQENFVFTDSKGACYEWVAEMKELQAQHFVSLLGSKATRVGIDWHEWILRKNP